jgi:D-alanine-D-alanine ligase
MANGYEKTTLFDFTGDNINDLASLDPDVCFVALHGRFGEDGVIQGYLEAMGIPYTGSGVRASVLALDKYLSKLVFLGAGVPTPKMSKNIPCVVKPVAEGSSVGVVIVKDIAELNGAIANSKKYSEKVLVEEFIEGKELTVSVFGEDVFPPIWIKPKSGVYDYESKYTKGATEYVFDLDMSADVITEVKEIALKAYKSLGCRGVARVDLIHDGVSAYVLEVNTVPGMTETSLLPKSAEKSGLPFIALIERMLKEALT